MHSCTAALPQVSDDPWLSTAAALLITTPTAVLLLAHALSSSKCMTMQVLCPRGSPIPPGVVEGAAAAAGLQLRTGCNCNPGVCLPNLGITPEEVSTLVPTNYVTLLVSCRCSNDQHGSEHHRRRLLVTLRAAREAGNTSKP